MIASERLLLLSCFREVIAKYAPWSTLPTTAIEKIIRKLERGCYNSTIDKCVELSINRTFSEPKFVEIYSATCYRIIANLDPDQISTYLADNLISATIHPISVATMNSCDLCPAATAKEREELIIRTQQKKHTKVSHLYTCNKCGTNETVILEFQGRKLDEALKLSIKCVNCSHVWRR